MRISDWSSDVCSSDLDVTIETIEVDEPADNEVLVRSAACGVCHSDLHFQQGAMPHFPVPTVMGHAAAGVVVKGGKNVQRSEERREGKEWERTSECARPAYINNQTTYNYTSNLNTKKNSHT